MSSSEHRGCYIFGFIEIMASGKRPTQDWAVLHPIVGEEGLMSFHPLLWTYKQLLVIRGLELTQPVIPLGVHSRVFCGPYSHASCSFADFIFFRCEKP